MITLIKARSKASPSRLLAGLGLVFGAMITLGACANVIGLDGVEYDRRLCGADDECSLPSICRGNANGTFYCEPPPATGGKFGESAYTTVDGQQVGPNCLSGVNAIINDKPICTRPCRSDKHCGTPLPSCKDLPLTTDKSRSIPVCQAKAL